MDGAVRCSTDSERSSPPRRKETGEIAPDVKLRGAAQRLTGADAGAALLGVMDDEHGNVMPALQLAQVGEQRGDLAAGVLVNAVEMYERIEDEQRGCKLATVSARLRRSASRAGWWAR
jgi:hypothetical protein